MGLLGGAACAATQAALALAPYSQLLVGLVVLCLVCRAAAALSSPMREALLWPFAGGLLVEAPYMLPEGHSTVLLQALMCISGCWAFKVAALAMGRGVLARELEGGAGLWRFAGALLLPVVPTNAPGDAVHTARLWRLSVRKLCSALPKIALFNMVFPTCMGPAMRAAVAHTWAQPLLDFAYGCLLWLEVEGAGDLVDAISLAIFRIVPEPHFRNPLKASSLSELWACRWNLTVSALLRDLVYQPMCEGRLSATPKPPPAPQKEQQLQQQQQQLQQGQQQQGERQQGQQQVMGTSPGLGRPTKARKILALTATFAMSGLWHELVFLLLAFSPPPGPSTGPLAWWEGVYSTRGRWLAFFLIQAPLIILERELRHAAEEKGWKMPSWLPRALTTAVFMALVSTLWMPPCYWPLPNYRAVSTEQAHGSSSLMDRVIEQSTNDMRRLGSALGI